MMESRLIFTDSASDAVRGFLEQTEHDVAVIVTDSTVSRLVLPCLSLPDLPVAEIKPGEDNKNIETLQSVWQTFIRSGLTRNSIIINVGGGVVTDLGGFAAATFKRGLRFINIPTTLLCAVDAAVGGKTGIDFCGLKNEVGAFAPAEAVIFDSNLFETLPDTELLSGFCEMVKHSLIDSPESYAQMLATDIFTVTSRELNSLLHRNVTIKKSITNADPLEKGLRKSLNLGHTAGHAFESFMLRHGHAVTHGAAVGCGLLVMMILSNMILDFPSTELSRYASFIKRYGLERTVRFGCSDYDELIEIMGHDKKNPSVGEISFTLLEKVGKPVTDVIADRDKIKIAFDIYRDYTGL